MWRIHVYIWQNQYNIVKLKNKLKKKNNALYSQEMYSKHIAIIKDHQP